MIIRGFLSESFQDWDMGLASVIFTGGCNFSCHACYAGKLVRSEEKYETKDILKRLERKKSYIDKVVICGGEPTLNDDLPDFMKKLKDKKFSIKLDTNGTNPIMLKEILENKLADCVAMDVKAPQSLYPLVTGIKEIDFDGLEESMSLVSRFPAYEFRTTVFPIFEKEKGFRWMTPAEISDMTKWIVESTGSNKHLHYLQAFTARKKDDMINEIFAKENLPKEYWETPMPVLMELQETARKYLPKACVR
jgi:pyruvate formate lyase activating enzyme